MLTSASPLCFQVVVEEGIGTLGMKPSNLPPEPVIISHVDANGWAQLNGVSVGDELVQVNGVKVSEISVVMLDNFLRKMRPLLLTFLSADSKRGWAKSPKGGFRSTSPGPACEKAVQAQVESGRQPSPDCSCNVHTAEVLAEVRLAARKCVEPVMATRPRPVVPEEPLGGAAQPPRNSEGSDAEDGGGAPLPSLGLSRGSAGSVDPAEEELLQGLVGTWVYSRFEYEISRLHSRRVLFEQVQFDERDPSSVVRVSGILRPRSHWLQGEILDKDKVRLGSMRIQWREESDTAISSVMLVHEDEWGPELVAHRKRTDD